MLHKHKLCWLILHHTPHFNITGKQMHAQDNIRKAQIDAQHEWDTKQAMKQMGSEGDRAKFIPPLMHKPYSRIFCLCREISHGGIMSSYPKPQVRAVMMSRQHSYLWISCENCQRVWHSVYGSCKYSDSASNRNDGQHMNLSQFHLSDFKQIFVIAYWSSSTKYCVISEKIHSYESVQGWLPYWVSNMNTWKFRQVIHNK